MNIFNNEEIGYNTKYATVRVLKGIIVLAIIMLIGLFFIIPKLTNKHIIQNTYNCGVNIINQMNIHRNSYKKDIKDGKKLDTILSNFTKNYYKSTDIRVNFLTFDKLYDKEVANFFKKNPTKIYKQILKVDSRVYLQIVKQESRNNIIEVLMPINRELEASKELTEYILIFIVINIVGLIFYYLYVFSQYEAKNLEYSHDLKQKIIDEIAKNVKREKQLAQTAKSIAMGEMMAAIIHQWKQPINAISVANSSLELDLELGSVDTKEALKLTSQINEQLSYMIDTMDSFRNFFKPGKKSKFSLYDSVKKVLKLVGKILKQHISINVNVKKDVFTEGYVNEFIQVIINILNNARDVIEERNPKYKDVDITIFEENNKAVMTINDYAGGVPEKIIDKIFEPYVTTKGDKKGTGIGLDMSKTIIEKVGGEISVKNKEYERDGEKIIGACFRIEMPLVEEDE